MDLFVEKAAAIENVRTSSATCLKEGTPHFPCPNKHQTYTEVVDTLRKKGHLTSKTLPEENETEDEEVNRQEVMHSVCESSTIDI